MLREQMLRCQEYKREGEAALGPIVSLLSATQDEKKAERKRAELVIRAQQETLSRLNSNIFIQFIIYYIYLLFILVFIIHVFKKSRFIYLTIFCNIFRTTPRTYREDSAT